ncbi:coiled-coil domain-containing protein 81-like isoform X1 [Frankliniella occidentalis]|uniref:Coiled-coil domain-containing protein 81-like isoform X1 n=1 Tax=Frankliniella occidentalis TaxID=133901 RepID=A0A6J1TLW2_FRAOC|nr:coiled-coil domain-containing protein 81-like isoform X1 [Frankliniella occidentalis]
MVQYTNVLETAKNNFQTGIGKNYSPADVEEVWKQVAQFIRSSLLKKRAVDIKGLGRFTIQEYSMPVSSIYAVWSHRPVFYLDKRLCDSYHIKCVRLFSSDKISVVSTNLSTIAALTNLSRHAVEDIINEVVQALCRLCMAQKDLELPLPGLGTLRIVDRYTDMRYSRELVRAVHRDIADPLVMASHVRACDKRPPPRASFLAPVAVPPRYLRELHDVNYG